jgi:hypothetical protein
VPFPDALMLPATLKKGGRLADRVKSITDVAEPLLGLDRPAGQRAWIRQQPHGRLFITASTEDTIYFARDHAKAGQPRYRWERRDDGVELGYLVEGAGDAG